MIPTQAAPSQEAYDRIIADILAQPEYRYLRFPGADFLANARKNIEAWVIEQLGRLFDQPPVSTPFSGGASVVMIILSAMGLIALVLLVAGLFSGVFTRSGRVHGILGETITPETTPDTLREKAREAERSGDIRQAVRLGFIAALLKMHRARLVFLDETWTNQELYAHLERNRFASLPALRGVMAGFNAAWYGHKPISGTAYDQWQRDLDQVWQEVASREV